MALRSWPYIEVSQGSCVDYGPGIKDVGCEGVHATLRHEHEPHTPFSAGLLAFHPC